MRSGKDLHQIWAKPLKIADPCIASNNLGKSMSLQNYNRFKEAIKMTSKKLKKLDKMIENGHASASKHF